MQRMICIITALIAITFALPTLAQSPGYVGAAASDPLTAELLAQENSVIQAEMRKDTAAVARALADEFVFINFDGHEMTKDELLGVVAEGFLKEYTIYEPQTLKLGDGAVMLTYNAMVRVAVDDDEVHIPRYQRISTIWVKQGAAWKMKFHQAAALQVGS